MLALGNSPPARLPVLESIAASDRYIPDPWSIGAASEKLDSVLLIGSGLTMVDAALRLAALRPRVRHIHVLSRHGWLPEVQATELKPASEEEKAKARKVALYASRTNFILSFPMLLCMIASGHGLPL